MRPQTQTDHIECSNKKNLWVLRTVAPVQIDNFWIMRNLQSKLGHTGRMVWIELGCTCTKRSDTERLTSACAFDTCLALHSNVFHCDLFCLPKTLTCEKYGQTRLWSVCVSSRLVWRRLKDTCVKRK